jgi:hypothetical protein
MFLINLSKDRYLSIMVTKLSLMKGRIILFNLKLISLYLSNKQRLQ